MKAYGCLVVLSVLLFASGLRIKRQDDAPADGDAPKPDEPAAATGKICSKCLGDKCDDPSTAEQMDCTKEKMSAVVTTEAEKKMWESVGATDELKAAMDAEATYTHCLISYWEGGAIRGCIPEKLGDKGFCEVMTEKLTGDKKNCSVCPVAAEPCNLPVAGAKDDKGDGKKSDSKTSYEFSIHMWILATTLLSLVL